MSYSQGQQHQEQRIKVVAGYALQQRLGSGSFATVYKGVRVKQQQQQQQQQQPAFDDDENDSSSSSNQRQDKQEKNRKQAPSTVAVKAIARTSEKLTKKVLQNLEIEISILRTYRHPNIVCMHDVQKTDRHFYLLLEYCGGGDVQHLIRSRQKGRLSERLTRRLMRDLASGLRFLWGQELIHRDIKPQNLLLTGPVPVEELAENPPIASKSGSSSDSLGRSIHDDPNLGFSLKIADFGFARHLQTASLAETLCGSPLYMAPEILQHHRYDAKADLWSVGTVLFEMIAGRPPFNGENHIDLLRNIQRKAVRLPPDVRVSKACVNLLRLLLNRNPLSRAGFKEFFEACDAFVALGCGGTPTGENEGGVKIQGGSGSNRIATAAKDLGTIHENDDAGIKNPSSDSLMTIATNAEQQQAPSTSTQQQVETAMDTNPASTHQRQQSQQQQQAQRINVVSPNIAPLATPGSAALIPNSINMYSNSNAHRQQTSYQAPNIRNRLAPLTSSPPTSLRPVLYPSSQNRVPPLLPSPTGILNNQQQAPFQQQHQMSQQQSGATYYSSSSTGIVQANSVSQSQVSVNDDSGFVMVEHTKSPTSSQHYYATSPQQYRGSNSGNDIVEQRARASKGMLSTSPGTGKILLGMVNRATIGFGVGGVSNVSSQQPPPNAEQQIEQSSRMAKIADQIAVANKMIATAEDVGRRAVSVAHLGDSRAYLGMRLVFKTNEEGSSLLSSTPMEGVVEEDTGNNESASGNIAVDSHDFNNSSSNDIMTSTRQRSSSVSADKPMMAEESLEDEMPFAISPDTPSVSLPSRSNPSVYNRSPNISGMKKSSTMSASPLNIRTRFGEALSCYLKALKMLKGAVGAAQRVTKDLQEIEERIGQRNNDHDIPKMKQRCEITSNWLCSQFRGVLERADAANVEISKLVTNSENKEGSSLPNTVSVEELIYNHALASGRDGAVKQLLGQYEAARSCYRSAGLLAETLLMEVNIGAEDRKILEGYVDGFAARITELDQLMLQQSRMAISSNTNPSQSQQSRRGSGIVGLIGPPSTTPATSGPFVVGSPR
eukprot:CAMPEP_0116116426 /NCGR_PEP_ID=MMETSP0329-20121206/1032_1 /TAXON_ID=697910 /ORGANISM="Pseudo-nitzschia arenysensis, Strain B593" /LENGTH=1057 /DNA_ID=CAMNT_0003609921 /DNA_START=468 /DNA_END=3641 /DNA_ORIENTATION=-